ncbi:MAG TPA: hypothetical protein PKD20_05150 [Candidatus Saccharibacteria bacterium]|jgi:hypothetical protein|nr:hypothetical protein [Candidatus Saccharibacteria bacterium]HMT56230.1 hypothetical protein [Candidatus Saccharibacteria bacterium]
MVQPAFQNQNSASSAQDTKQGLAPVQDIFTGAHLQLTDSSPQLDSDGRLKLGAIQSQIPKGTQGDIALYPEPLEAVNFLQRAKRWGEGVLGLTPVPKNPMQARVLEHGPDNVVPDMQRTLNWLDTKSATDRH